MIKKSTNKKNIYLYPITSRGGFDSGNPYINDLARELEKSYNVINLNKPSSSGILQMFRCFFKTDIAFFNWIENLPDRKGGSLQVFLLKILIYLYHVTGKKVVWTMHNKISHTKKNYRKKKALFIFMLKHSNLILTHSKEGIAYGTKLYKNAKEKINYLAHPVNSKALKPSKITDKKYDFLIWGTMVPYKGVHNFLEFLNLKGIEDEYSILIIGKFNSDKYFQEVNDLAGNNTKIENRYPSMDELHELTDQSRFVLFTYNNSSVLSSGALMDTLAMGASILGPHTGAFADLSSEGIIHTFKDYSEIPEIVQQDLKNYEVNKEIEEVVSVEVNKKANKEIYQELNIEVKNDKYELFMKNNSWGNAGKNICVMIETIRHVNQVS
jgi:glycosyltransferase involved in cell wall biosynthesis